MQRPSSVEEKDETKTKKEKHRVFEKLKIHVVYFEKVSSFPPSVLICSIAEVDMNASY
jgi:hypothetical protein